MYDSLRARSTIGYSRTHSIASLSSTTTALLAEPVDIELVRILEIAQQLSEERTQGAKTNEQLFSDIFHSDTKNKAPHRRATMERNDSPPRTPKHRNMSTHRRDLGERGGREIV